MFVTSNTLTQLSENMFGIEPMCKQIFCFLCAQLEFKALARVLSIYFLSSRIITYLYWQITEGRKIMIRLLHEQIINVSLIGSFCYHSPTL